MTMARNTVTAHKEECFMEGRCVCASERLYSKAGIDALVANRDEWREHALKWRNAAFLAGALGLGSTVATLGRFLGWY